MASDILDVTTILVCLLEVNFHWTSEATISVKTSGLPLVSSSTLSWQLINLSMRDLDCRAK